MIRNIIFNGTSGTPALIRPWVNALNDPRIVTEKAGFLFKALLYNDHIELAAQPCLINGERLYHYNLLLSTDDPCILIGDVNAAGIFTVLFKPNKGGLTDDQKKRCRNGLKTLAELLLLQGYKGEGLLCDVTRMVLPEIGLSPTLQTLIEIAASEE